MKTLGSFQNRLYEKMKMPNPTVGEGITIFSYSDRSAGTITRVHKNGKRFWFKPDIATRTDNNGMSEVQEYSYKINDEATEREVFLSKSGEWKIKGNGRTVGIGNRQAYHDYSF